MHPEEFIIWLNGVLDSVDNGQLSKKQFDLIKKMLGKVEFDDYTDKEIVEKDMPLHSIWQASSTAHSSVEKIVMEYIEN